MSTSEPIRAAVAPGSVYQEAGEFGVLSPAFQPLHGRSAPDDLLIVERQLVYEVLVVERRKYPRPGVDIQLPAGHRRRRNKKRVRLDPVVLRCGSVLVVVLVVEPVHIHIGRGSKDCRDGALNPGDTPNVVHQISDREHRG